MDICFVTSNRNKVREIEHALSTKLKVVPLDLPEIQAIEVSKVVMDKAERAYKALRRPVIVEDTGIYIKALNGFPGALAKFLLESIGTEDICKMLDSFDNREAHVETCFCFYDGRRRLVFSGKAKGTITNKPRKGVSDFGWNSIFIPDGHSKTYSEMSLEEKNRISMRAKAVEKLRNYLKEAY